MKRTTYIIVGTLLFFMIAMFASIYYYSLGGNKKKGNLEFSSELAQVDISGVRVIRLLRTDKNHGNFVSGVLRIAPSLSASKNELSYSKDLRKYIKKSLKGDTLILDLCFSEDLLPEEFSDRGSFIPSNLQLYISADSTLKAISNDVNGLALNIFRLDSREMSFASRSEISVDSCSFESVRFSGLSYRTHLGLSRSKISNLYLNAKRLDWNVDSCNIDTEYILESGGTNNIHTWKKGECKKLIWSPRQSGKKLFMAIDAEASITF